jgi:hypothetical protein
MPAKAKSLTSVGRKPMTTEGRVEDALHNGIVDAVQHGRDSVTVTLIRADAMILHTRLKRFLKN